MASFHRKPLALARPCVDSMSPRGIRVGHAAVARDRREILDPV